MTKKEDPKITKDRKDDHINICSDDDSKIVMIKTNGFEDIHFIHRALPKSDFDDIKLNTEFLMHKLDFPRPRDFERDADLSRLRSEIFLMLGVPYAV